MIILSSEASKRLLKYLLSYVTIGKSGFGRSIVMKENIVQKLTSKDDKYACAFTDRIVAESHDTDEW